MSKPLAGVKVVELATFVAGPVSARLLADLGAEVIKVERPEGDAWRATGVSYLPNRFSKALRILASVSVSTAERESSKIMMGVFWVSIRAMAARCF